MNKYRIRYGGAMIGDEEVKAIVKTINKDRRNWQASSEAQKMEQEASKFLGVKYGILTNSGSSAGLLALSALELPKGSEVIISACTFPTIFNIILQCGLVPVVVDATIGTYNFDISEVQKAITEKTKAIIAINALGNPVDMTGLMKLVRIYGKRDSIRGPLHSYPNGQKIWVLEDFCDAWGTTIGGRKVGSFGDIGITSFHAAHIVSMGVGGGVFTSNANLALKVRMYRDWGRQADINVSENKKWKQLPKDYNPRFIYEKIGYNFQILELQAAMGRIQLRKTEKIKELRKRNFNYLYSYLQHYWDQGLVNPKWNYDADICWFALPLTYHGDRGKLLRHLEKAGIETRPLFAANITRHPAYVNSKYRISGKLKEADYIMKHSFWISVHPSLTKKDLNYIVGVFDDFFK